MTDRKIDPKTLEEFLDERIVFWKEKLELHKQEWAHAASQIDAYEAVKAKFIEKRELEKGKESGNPDKGA